MVLDEATKNQVKELLGRLQDEVSIVYVDKENPVNKVIRELVQELSDISDKIKLTIYTHTDKEAKVLGLEEAPAIVLLGKNIKGKIVYYGIPSGHEFATLLDTIIRASTNNPGLTAKSIEFLNSLKEKMKMNVFVTPTCPHCPTSASIALRYAMYSDKVIGQVIEASEFPEWSQRFNVMGVPKTVINDKGSYVGGYPEDLAVDQIKQALQGMTLGE